ncbi:MAG: hypothetical protein U0531_19400 [Dehalococcoidia bacterium]
MTVGHLLALFSAPEGDPGTRFIDAQLLDATGCTSADCAAVNGRHRPRPVPSRLFHPARRHGRNRA